MSTSRAHLSLLSLNKTLASLNQALAAIIDGSSRGLRGPLLAALLTFICAVPCAMLMPPLDRDESRFTQATAQMLETGDYVRIMLQDVPRNKKPVGIHWLQALSVALTSKVEARQVLAYRWPSILGAALAAFACAWGAGKAFGTRTGLRAGVLFGVSFMLSTEAFWAKTDAVQCGFITLMMAALAQIYLRTRDLAKDETVKNGPAPKLFWLMGLVPIYRTTGDKRRDASRRGTQECVLYNAWSAHSCAPSRHSCRDVFERPVGLD